MHNVALNYRTLLSVTNVLNSQRNRQSLFRAITEQLTKVVRWERAGITVYHLQSDAFRFYAVETNLPKVVLRSDAMIPRVRARWAGSMIIIVCMCGLAFRRNGCSSRMSATWRKAWVA